MVSTLDKNSHLRAQYDEFTKANRYSEEMKKMSADSDRLKNESASQKAKQTLLKVILIATMVIAAIAAVALFPLTLPLIGNFAFIITAVGGLTVVVAAVALSVLNRFFRKKDVFTPAIEGLNKLYYKNDIPVLELSMNYPHAAGVAHGKLLGKEILEILASFNADEIDSKSAKDCLEQFKSNKAFSNYTKEMEGIVVGVNEWIANQNWPNGAKPADITLNHIFKLQIAFEGFNKSEEVSQQDSAAPIPAINLGFSTEQEIANSPSLKSSVIHAGDKKTGFSFAMNIDIENIAVINKYLFLIHRKYADDKRSHEHQTIGISFPGSIGIIAGFNKEGLCLALKDFTNVAPKKDIPAIMNNRYLLECFKNLNSLWEDIASGEWSVPYRGYDLLLADTKPSAGKIQFVHPRDYNSADKVLSAPIKRINLADIENAFIATRNEWSAIKVESDANVTINSEEEGETAIDDFSQPLVKTIQAGSYTANDIAKASLALPFVNTANTACHLSINTGMGADGKPYANIQVAFASSFAANHQTAELSLIEMFRG